jgi:DNA-binding response OmpR family regulator
VRRSFGDVSLDMRNGWLIVGDRRLNVRPAVGRLCAALIAARGNVATADQLREAMCLPGHPEVSVQNLRVGLYELRDTLIEAGARTRIENRRGYGWRLEV